MAETEDVDTVEMLRHELNDAYSMAERVVEENHDLHVEVNEYRKWKKVHYAVYFLLFVYGMVCGVYFRRNDPEL